MTCKTTHHNVCDCREAYFKRLEERHANLKKALVSIASEDLIPPSVPGEWMRLRHSDLAIICALNTALASKALKNDKEMEKK